MFWRTKSLRTPTAAERLHALLTNGDSAARPSKVVGQARQLIRSTPSFDVNHPILIDPPPGCSITPPVLPLTLALHQRWSAEAQLGLVRLLLEHGARPRWGTPYIKSHYMMAIEQGNYDAADLILARGMGLIGKCPEDDDAFGDIMAAVFRTALSVHLPSNLSGSYKFDSHSVSDAPAADLECGLEDGDSGGLEANNATADLTSGSLNSATTDSTGFDLSENPSLWSPAMLAAAWLIDQSADGRAARLEPGGAASVVHSILRIFAEQVESEARQKHDMALTLAMRPMEEREAAEQALKKERSAAVSCLLHRLWALLQLAMAAGSPAVAVSVDTFPAPPPHPMCDLDLVWTGVKNFATSWMPCWDRETHCMYHPKFKAAAKEFVLAARARGFLARGSSGRKETFLLDNCLVEKIVGHMADDQGAWVTALE